MRDLVAKAQTAAHDAEARGELLEASGLFILLTLHEEKPPSRRRIRRVNQRLIMLRSTPPSVCGRCETLARRPWARSPCPRTTRWATTAHETRDHHEVLVERAMGYAEQHVEQTGRTPMLVGGLESCAR
ncbi:MAG: hypothetical protein IPM33_13695 [Phycisphaerales bacterium]|nr:hypothetical protein [Phycisphaerales bacterium]